VCAGPVATLSVPDHGAAQMDAKVHLVRPVHHRDVEEMIGLGHLALRRPRAVGSVGRGADLDAAVRRHRHRSFRASCRERVRDFRPLALADEELAGFRVLPACRESPQPAASAGREQVVPVAAVEKVVVRPDQARRIAALQMAERIAGAMERQAVVTPGAEQEAQCSRALPEELESLPGRRAGAQRAQARE